MVLFHTRQKYVQVFESDSEDKVLNIKAYLDSSCVELYLKMTVKIPQMLIESVECQFERSLNESCSDLISASIGSFFTPNSIGSINNDPSGFSRT